MELHNGEFAINGYKFGCGHNANVSTLNATGIRWRVQDQPNPVGDDLLLGRDFMDPQPIKLGVFFKGQTAQEVAAYDRSVVIDAMNKTVTRDDGVSLAGKLTRKSRLDQIQVPAGASEFYFRGTSPDGSATATIRWGSAHASLGA